MSCSQPASDMFVDGQWLEAIVCWMTAGGDPGLMVLMPMLVYGTILTAYFVVGGSPLIPVVVSIILSGVIFSSFPPGALRIALIVIILVPSIAGLVLTWRFGR